MGPPQSKEVDGSAPCLSRGLGYCPRARGEQQGLRRIGDAERLGDGECLRVGRHGHDAQFEKLLAGKLIAGDVASAVHELVDGAGRCEAYRGRTQEAAFDCAPYVVAELTVTLRPK